MARPVENSIFQENIVPCSDWRAIRDQFDDQLPKRARGWHDGEIWQTGWIFRGHKQECYPLKPTIERAYLGCTDRESALLYGTWAETEYLVLREFQSKAGLHMDAARLPESDDRLGWFAIMQHYGAPTRLLDFSYSPYVALYFALRNRKESESPFAEVWALDATALREKAKQTSQEADKVVGGYTEDVISSPVNFGLREFYRTAGEETENTDKYWDTCIRQALKPCAKRREHFNQQGFVAEASPTTHNPRLASQQGVFLLNGAEGRTFEESLKLMMSGVKNPWYKRFQIPKGALRNIEGELFQLNVHDLSLFPDTEGLAGFVGQKIRLHW